MSNRPKSVTVARKTRRFDKYGNPTPATPATPKCAQDVKGAK